VGEGSLDAASDDPFLDVAPEVFIERLETYERVLLDVKTQLYDGSWDGILEDLRARMEGKPYVFKLSKTIARDIAAVERMKAYEIRNTVSLSKLIRPQTQQ
jgi:hypothetical protein